MVDNCDTVVAVWNGTSGGTKNCIDYAKKQNKPVANLYKSYLELNKKI
jgi:nucleoside 2-deoxyribosyltransferase